MEYSDDQEKSSKVHRIKLMEEEGFAAPAKEEKDTTKDLVLL